MEKLYSSTRFVLRISCCIGCYKFLGVQVCVINTCSISVTLTGLYFDKLTFLPHVLKLHKKCEPSFNLVKVLLNTYWRADRGSLLKIYRAIICSKIDYTFMQLGS